MGRKFKFQVQDCDLECLFWQCEKHIAPSEKKTPLVSGCNKTFFDSIFRSQNLVEEWLQKMPSLPTPASSSSEGGGATSAPSALNLSLNHSGRPIIQPAQYSRSSPGAFNNSNSNSMTHITTPKSASISGGSTPSQMDSLKSRAIRDIQLSHTKDMHGN